MSDTPLSKMLNQGSSMTSHTIGQVAQLEADLAAWKAMCAELADAFNATRNYFHIVDRPCAAIARYEAMKQKGGV